MKNTRVAALLLLASLLTACAGSPQSDSVATNAAPATTNTPAEPGSPDELVCEYEKVTGSHFKKRVCMTRGEREQLRLQTQEAMRSNPSPAATEGN